MGFAIHGFRIAFLRPGGTVKLYVSGPVELNTVFSDLKNLAKNLVAKIENTSKRSLSEVSLNPLHPVPGPAKPPPRQRDTNLDN